MEKHNARMYVQSTEARRESHCCEQFERRADLPEEEVDVLFLGGTSGSGVVSPL